MVSSCHVRTSTCVSDSIKIPSRVPTRHRLNNFEAAKAPLAAAVPLAHPAPNAVLSLATNASHTHVGGVLQQLDGGSWQPLAFYSKKLSGAGTRYSTFDRELLAAFSAVRHFRFLLKG
jgi:hypothetical protein